MDRTGWEHAETLVSENGSPELLAPTKVDYELNYVRGVPPVINDAGVHRLPGRGESVRALGPNGAATAEQSTGAEDFAILLEHVPGALARLGVCGAATVTPGGPALADVPGRRTGAAHRSAPDGQHRAGRPRRLTGRFHSPIGRPTEKQGPGECLARPLAFRALLRVCTPTSLDHWLMSCSCMVPAFVAILRLLGRSTFFVVIAMAPVLLPSFSQPSVSSKEPASWPFEVNTS